MASVRPVRSSSISATRRCPTHNHLCRQPCDRRPRSLRQHRHRARRQPPIPQSKPDPPNRRPARRRRRQTRQTRHRGRRRSPPSRPRPARRTPPADKRRHGLPLTIRVSPHWSTNPAPTNQTRHLRRSRSTHRPPIRDATHDPHRNRQLHRRPPQTRRPSRHPLVRRRRHAHPPSRSTLRQHLRRVGRSSASKSTKRVWRWDRAGRR